MSSLHLNDDSSSPSNTTQIPSQAAAKPGQTETKTVYVDSGAGGGAKVAILFGAVAALAAATGYGFYQTNQLRMELTQTREILASEIGKVNESSSSGAESTRATITRLNSQLDEARRQSTQAVGQAKLDAARQADLLAAKLELAQEVQAAQVAKVTESISAVSTEVSAVKADTNLTKVNVNAVSQEVATVKNQAEATRADLEKTIAELSSTKGDLGMQSGLIATNARQLAALRERGERVYTEFSITKSKTGQKVGDFQIRLTSTDPKKNRYTVEVMVDDKKVEKKDRTANEPVQFLIPRSVLPYELVVNEVKKDVIVGYVSAPRVAVSRN
jgi:chromosome segregation ATPase